MKIEVFEFKQFDRGVFMDRDGNFPDQVTSDIPADDIISVNQSYTNHTLIITIVYKA